VARIRTAEIDEDGRIHIHSKGVGLLQVLFAVALIVGGVWIFESAYGARAEQAAYEKSETVSN
jgi:hypothetical protein